MTDSEFDDDKTHSHVVLTPGTMVSHYRIVEKIGAGGMGEVYLVEDTKLQRKMALKFLPERFSQDKEFVHGTSMRPVPSTLWIIHISLMYMN